ncbi:biotin--[acetyl-CoA-carboxylase] ligase [Mycolicibacterium sp. CBMA 226]|uniref:biotin--[acetyl-CoA-carboxylase] ligase n=1 Tax=Mycolicibacterium sp. CBMA 226 TaxID=2606611 RepID=UPI0012DCD429|nr:biotin--[acetyl-CoA-carboxylase] ligase [Mycolicibacterium sp. CBMA 226]MUL76878.1 biotin--[acetyl-CoA-carboxylase] ligase [Mycolicibacterium sp. CBMA 226]
MTADLQPLDAAAIQAEAGDNWRVEVVTETGSTNADLAARAQAGENVAGVARFAEDQTEGRGRQGRSWSAVPRSQILVSVGVDTTDVPSETWGLLSLATGVAVVEAVAEVAGVAAALKWPNDVLVGAGKLAGILSEVAAPGGGSPVIVVGIGLNVSLAAAELPDPAAVSLLSLGVAQPDRQRLAVALLNRLHARIAEWRVGGNVELLAIYRKHSSTLGQSVRAELPGGREVVGQATDVDAGGALVIDSGDGAVTVAAGDVVHLRPVTS